MNEDSCFVWHKHAVTLDDYYKANGYKSCVLWFTGLSASGKSTIAHALDRRFHDMHVHSYVLDGDNIRHGLNKDLGLVPEDRKENIRRIGEVSKLFINAGLLAIAAFIAPYREDRRLVRELMGRGRFIEVYVKCSLSECKRRDPKGFYKKAINGEIREFTGISAPYEEPQAPEIILETDTMSLEQCIERILKYLYDNQYINSKRLIQKKI